MPRNPSKILSVAEAKASELGKKISEAQKEVVKAEKVLAKAEAVYTKLVERQNKAEAKAEEKRLGATPSET